MKVTFKGRVARAPVLYTLPNGKSCVRLSVADNYYYWSQKDEPLRHKGVIFYETVAYDDNAEKIAHLKKGAPIEFSGNTNLVLHLDKPNEVSLVVKDFIPAKTA